MAIFIYCVDCKIVEEVLLLKSQKCWILDKPSICSYISLYLINTPVFVYRQVDFFHPK